MNILHISDIHFRKSYNQFEMGYKGMIWKMDNPLRQLKMCLDHVKEKMTIGLLLISGDLTEDGEVEDYAYLKEWLSQEIGDIPIVVTLGNHDIKSNFRVGWLNEAPSNKPYNIVKTFDEFHVISFDNSVYERSDGSMTDSQFNWLEEQLKKFQDKPIVLMTHHHLLEGQSSTPVLPESNRLIKMISEYPAVLCLLNGHTHHVYNGDIGGIQYYTVGGMSFVGEDEGEGQVRFEQRFGYNTYQTNKGVIKQQTSENFITGKIIARVNMMEEN